MGTGSSYRRAMLSRTSVNLGPSSLNLQNCGMFLDFDGTLVDIVERPEDVFVHKSLSALLEKLQKHLNDRLAIVSGRSILQLEGFFGTAADGLTLVGSHGAEIRLAGQSVTSPFRPDALDEAEIVFSQVFSDKPNIVIEVKSFGLAIHYRLDPSMEGTATKMAAEFAKRSGLELQHGKMMVELRTLGHDKGTAINSLLSVAPFAGYLPIFIGDDLTDEPGFEACAADGGFGILVGSARETAARYRLENVAAVHEWLGTI